MKLNRFLPILDWLPHYNRTSLKGDLLAGLTVGVMLIPQGMAYALLAGLPPIYGLYAGLVPLLLYAFFGTSRQLSVGPVALVSLLILAGISPLAEKGSPEFVQLAITTALIAGIIQVLMGVFRLGFLVNFLSQPVIAGFTAAAAFIIGFSQLGNLLGMQLPRSNYIHEIIRNVVANIDQIHWPTLIVSAGALLMIFLLRRINKALPAALITVILGTAVVGLFGLADQGVEITGKIPEGLPAFTLPHLDWKTVQTLFPLALTICIISFIESLAIAKTIEAKHKSYRVLPNQELIALGLTKIGGSFFQSFPTTGSFTRSAINNEAGAKSGMSSIFSAALIGLTLAFLTPLFFYLPQAILAAIVVAAVVGLVNVKHAIHLWNTDRNDFAMLLVTFITTLTLGIQLGVLIGVVLSLALFVYANSRPHVAVLGQLSDSSHFRNVERFPEAHCPDKVLVMRFDAQLYFGNVTHFRDRVEDLVQEHGTDLKFLVLDASSIHDIDSSGLSTLDEVNAFLKSRNIQFLLAGMIGPVRDKLARCGLMQRIGKDHLFLQTHEAVAFANGQPQIKWSEEAAQTKFKF